MFLGLYLEEMGLEYEIANALSGDQERLLVAGMNDFPSKPYTKKVLKNVLLRWLG